MAREQGAPDGRWMIGWLLKLSGVALSVGVAIGAVGAFRRWGLDVPPMNVVTMAALLLGSGALFAGGQWLMKAPALEGAEKNGDAGR